MNHTIDESLANDNLSDGGSEMVRGDSQAALEKEPVEISDEEDDMRTMSKSNTEQIIPVVKL